MPALFVGECEYCNGIRDSLAATGEIINEIFKHIPESWWDERCTTCTHGRGRHVLSHPHKALAYLDHACSAFTCILDESFED